MVSSVDLGCGRRESQRAIEVLRPGDVHDRAIWGFERLTVPPLAKHSRPKVSVDTRLQKQKFCSRGTAKVR